MHGKAGPKATTAVGFVQAIVREVFPGIGAEEVVEAVGRRDADYDAAD